MNELGWTLRPLMDNVRFLPFLASQDAQEVMYVSQSVSQ